MSKQKRKSAKAQRGTKKKAPKPSGPGPAEKPTGNTETASAGTARKSPGRERLLLWSLSIASGVLWFLSCADFDIVPLAWFAMVPALWVIEKAPTLRSAWFYCWIAGIVANAGGFYWVAGMLERFAYLPSPVAIFGLILLSAYQAVVFLLFARVLRRVREISRERLGRPLPMALLAPVVMVCFELLVPFIFPWYLAITQAWVPAVIQIAELTGPLGVTAMLLACNGAIYDAIFETEKRRKWVPVAGAALFIGSALIFGAVRLGQVDAARERAPKLRLGLVQGNIAFDQKGIKRRELAGGQLRALQLESTRLEAEGAELIIWTESSYPYFIDREATRDFSNASPWKVQRYFKSPIIFGAVTRKKGDDYPYNSALMLDREGNFIGRFDKTFLLIFGEYIPFLETFPWIKKILPQRAGHFARGKDIVTFPFERDGVEYRLGPMICYEDILADFGRELAKHKPHLLVNITNDAWFGDTSEPWEHMALSVYRAVEMRTDMVRAVNTGVSAFIDANGRVFKETYAVDPATNPIGVDGIVGDVVLMEGGHSFYARFGNVFGYGCVLATLFLWLVWRRLPVQARSG